MKQIFVALAMLLVLATPGVHATTSMNVQCFFDKACYNKVVKINKILTIYSKAVDTYYKEHGALILKEYELKKPTMSLQKQQLVEDKMADFFSKVYEVDDWTWALKNDMHTAIAEYNKNELDDIYNVIWDPRYELNNAYLMLKEIKQLLEIY